MSDRIRRTIGTGHGGGTDSIETAVTYTYDNLGQLTRVNDPYDDSSGEQGTTWVYVYDQGGNLTKKTAYYYTTGTPDGIAGTFTYTYEDMNWKDKLTGFGGKVITYDIIGNVTNDGIWAYNWERRRQLKSMSKAGTAISYTCNADGLRIAKTVNGVVTHYTLHK